MTAVIYSTAATQAAGATHPQHAARSSGTIDTNAISRLHQTACTAWHGNTKWIAELRETSSLGPYLFKLYFIRNLPRLGTKHRLI